MQVLRNVLPFLLLTSSLHANLWVYEGFEYTPSNQETTAPTDLTDGTLNGGTGWNAAWTKAAVQTPLSAAPILEGGLAYTDQHGNSLQAAGNHARIAGTTTANNSVSRSFSSPIPAAPGNIIYLSFIGQRIGEPADPQADVWNTDPVNYPNGYPWGDNLYPRGAELRTLNGSNRSSAIGNISDQPENIWNFNADSTHIYTEVPFTDQAFNVLKLEYYADYTYSEIGQRINLTGTIVTLWVNPSNLIAEDEHEAIRQIVYKDINQPLKLVVDGVGLSANDGSYNREPSAMLVDEIRVGSTWAAVTPIEGNSATWAGRTTVNGWAYAGTGYLGWVFTGQSPWIYCDLIQDWLYIYEDSVANDGTWVNLPSPDGMTEVTLNWYYHPSLETWAYVPNPSSSSWAYLLRKGGTLTVVPFLPE